MSNEERNQFSRLLKYYLMLNDKQQVDLVNDLGYSKSTVSGWCSGAREPELSVIIKIAEYLNVTVDELVVGSNNTIPSYYNDSSVRQAAEFLHANPQYKTLFDATTKIKPEDIDKVVKMMDIWSDNQDN